MHGAWSALTILTKKQHHNKWRKSELKRKLQEKKESYINIDNAVKDEFNFPRVSHEQLEKIKDEIRKEMKLERIKQILFSIFLLILISIIVYYLLTY